MATLTTILADIRQNVIDLPDATESRLVGWVNEAQNVAEARHKWALVEKTWIPITNTNLRWLSLVGITKPADWLLPIGDPWWRTGDIGKAVAMEWIPSDEDAAKDYPYTTLATHRGQPKGLREAEDYIYVYPVPDEGNTLGTYSDAGEYQVVIPYRASVAVLSEGVTITSVFTADPNIALFLTDYASGKAQMFNHAYDDGQVSLVMADAHLKRARRLDQLGRTQSIKLTPRRDVYASRRQYRRR